MRKVLSFILIMLLAFNGLVGCSNKKVTSVKETSEISYLNKYNEIEIKLPEDVTYINDIEINEGIIRISSIDDSDKVGEVWSSDDYGASWNLDTTFSEKIDTSNVDYIFNTLGPAGEVVLGTSINQEYKFYFIDDKGEVSNLTSYDNILKEEGVHELDYLEGDWFIGSDADYSVLLFNRETGEIRYPLSDDIGLRGYKYLDGILYLATHDDIKLVELESGDEINSKNLSSNFNSMRTKSTGSNMFAFSTLINNDEKKEVYYGGKEGLIKVTEEGNGGLLQGNKCTLGNSNFVVLDIYAENSESIYALLEDIDGNSHIFYYNYDDSISEESRELNVFTLGKNKFLEQAINLYQRQNRDFDIKLTVAREEYPELLDEDIIKNLNTEIANGNSPDIIFLDGINTEGYLNKDVLVDLTELVAEIESKEEIYQNIFRTFENEKGIFAVPLKFSFMIEASEYSDINGLNDFNSFIEQVKSIIEEEKEFSKQIVRLNQAVSIYYRLIFDDKENFTEENLKSFYSSLDELISIMEKYEIEDEMEEVIHEVDLSYIRTLPTNFEDVVLASSDKMIAAMDYIDSLYSYCQLIRCNELNDKLSYNIITSDDSKIFIPQSIVGISSKSKDIEEAKNLLKFLISEEGQSSYDYMNGLAINKNSLIKSMENVAEFEDEIYVDGTSKSLKIDAFNESEKEQFFNDINDMTMASILNPTIETIIMEEANKILHNNLKPDEAAKNVYKKLEIYLKE